MTAQLFCYHFLFNTTNIFSVDILIKLIWLPLTIPFKTA